VSPSDAAEAAGLFRLANVGARASKIAGGGCYRDGTVAADNKARD
jgi:hypothetical protein